MTLPTFSRIAETIEVTRCRGINPRTGGTCFADHERGEWSGGMVHWRDRRSSKAGIRRFLLLASNSNIVVANSGGWARIYLANRWAFWTAYTKLHLQIPAWLSQVDRTRVKSRLERDHVTTELRTEAMRWART